MRAAACNRSFTRRKVTVTAITRIFFPRQAKYTSPAALFSAPVSISGGGMRRVHVRLRGKCIARKYLALSPFAPSHPSRPFSRHRSFAFAAYKRVHFPPRAQHADHPRSVNISLRALRASPRFARALYSGGNCAEFQPLKCTEYRGGKRGGGKASSGASRNARKSGYLKIGSSAVQ